MGTGRVPRGVRTGPTDEEDTVSSTGSPGPLEGTGALITGGGSGIGLACARALHADGATVTLVGRDPGRLAAAAASLGDTARVRTVAADVVDEEAVAGAVERAADGCGLHAVVAAAGTGTLAPVLAQDAGEWRRVLEVNLTGAMLTFKHGAAAVIASGGGSMVGISSIAGILTHRHMAAYCASKAGLEMLVRTLADELGRAGVRVNAVQPGLVPTDLSSGLVADDEVRADYLAQMPLGRLGTAEEVAAAVRWLCGPESSWVTGQVLAVDGGHTLRRGPDLDRWARALFGPVADGVPPGGTSGRP